ncbi:MAG: InlB B-repeat-containing protein [Acholeplasmataceae bacterium]|nr:InlB B-repeat-containing protein [Acholeplasmataceae bacterium]
MKSKLIKFLLVPMVLLLMVFITACDQTVDNTEALNSAKNDLALVFASSDSASNVTVNLTLPTTVGDFDITWVSSNTAVISNAGVVVRPAAGEDDVSVTLTATITDGTLSVDKTFTLTVKAVPAPVTYTVTFDSNGGTRAVTQTIVTGEKATLPYQPLRDGYTFGGWYSDEALTTAWNFATNTVTANITLYAKWVAIMYSVTFEENGGSTVADLTNFTYGDHITAPTEPTRAGYTFGGWYKNEALTSAWVFTADVVKGDTTLYAKWTAIVYTVSFNVDGGSAVADLTNVMTGTTITAPTAPTKADYTFGGWYKEATLTNAWNFTTDMVTADTTLYAKWIPIVYTVSFNVDGGSAVADLTNVMTGTTITAPTAPTKANYTFDGWYKEVGLTTAWNFTTDTVTADTTLYAKWAPILFTVSFEVDGGSVVADLTNVMSGTSITAPTDPTKDGFNFMGWYKEVELTNLWVFATDVVSANTTLYAKWEAAIISISTAQQFYDMATGGSSDDFILANDIDFTGFTYTVTGSGTTFKGTLDGNGMTISNITVTGDVDATYGGIFQRTNGATIFDLTIDNANVTVPGRAGVLIGRIETSTTTLSNIVIMNSSVSGTKGEGVGILIGNASLGIVATNIQIINSTATNSNKNVSYIIGRADNEVTLSDIYVYGSTAESTASPSTDHGVAGLIGYTNNAAVVVTLTRIVIEDSILKGRSIGSLIGYFRYGSLSATDVMTDIEFVYGGVDGQQGIIGRRNTDSNTTDPVLSHVFAHFVNQQVGAAVQLDPAFMLADLTGLNQAWWTTNILGITQSALWAYDATSTFYRIAS